MRSNTALVLLAFLCSSCGTGAQPSADAGSTRSAQQTQVTAPAAPTPPVPERTGTAPIDELAVSDAPLGAFPYLSLPDGYAAVGAPAVQDYGEVYFWTGHDLRAVQGKVFRSNIHAVAGKTLSPVELGMNFAAELKQLGAVQLTNSRVTAAAVIAVPDAGRRGLNSGLVDIYNVPTQTWVIRRADRQIWVKLIANDDYASWAVVETKPFEATAKLLPAGEMKQAIDRVGKAVIHINFATDQAAILPTSQPQVGEIVGLLRANSALRLSISGYTDDTGTAAHNQSLSTLRADAVRAALVAAGIAPGRLEAKGFGQSQPVASNSTEDGKAQNRRVELVKL